MNEKEFKEKAKQLADEHWSYVECLLADSQYSAQIINLIGYPLELLVYRLYPNNDGRLQPYWGRTDFLSSS